MPKQLHVRTLNADTVKDYPGTGGSVVSADRVITSVESLTDDNQTIGVANKSVVSMTPTVTRILTLDDSYREGDVQEVVNLSASQLILIKANGTADMRHVLPGQRVLFISRQNTPTTGAHWWKGTGLWHRDLSAVTRAGVLGTLITYTIPANTLDADGKIVQFTCWGTKSGTNAVATIQVRFASVSLGSIDIASVGSNWEAVIRYIRTASAVQDVFFKELSAVGSGWSGASPATSGHTTARFVQDAETDTAAIAFDLRVGTINAGDTIVQEGLLVELLN